MEMARESVFSLERDIKHLKIIPPFPPKQQISLNNINVEELPRYLLAQNDKFYQLLISFPTSESMALLEMLPINKQIEN